MLLYRIDCRNCGVPRVGRKEDGDVEPLHDECPLCGSADYTVPAKDE